MGEEKKEVVREEEREGGREGRDKRKTEEWGGKEPVSQYVTQWG